VAHRIRRAAAARCFRGPVIRLAGKPFTIRPQGLDHACFTSAGSMRSTARSAISCNNRTRPGDRTASTSSRCKTATSGRAALGAGLIALPADGRCALLKVRSALHRRCAAQQTKWTGYSPGSARRWIGCSICRRSGQRRRNLHSARMPPQASSRK
jgi:hypothetical protein